MMLMNTIVHYCNSKTLFASRGCCIYKSTDYGYKWTFLCKLPLIPLEYLTSFTKLSRRLFRAGVHHILPIDKSALIIVACKSIFAYDLFDKKFYSINKLHGSRLLCLCKDYQNRLYYGEYLNNTERRPVSIYCSKDLGRSWTPAFTFDQVRHIHGVFYDIYENKIWVTTGDDDKEAGIHVTEDNFRNVEKVVGGTQQLRAVTLLFSKSHVYFGSDTPLEKNFIYRLDRKTGEVERLQEVESSVFWGCKVGENLFFSTAVEPSKVNRCKNACIWASKDGETWKCIAHYRKDIWPMKLFQYGQILFPAGTNTTDILWYTPFATQNHLTVNRLPIKDIL